MKIIVPLEVTDARLTSSTVAEDDYAAWSSSTSYSPGARVIRTTTHKVYEALTSNTNKTPESSPTDWLDAGATNRWRMFDKKVGTKTTATTTMSWVLAPGQAVQGVSLMELTGSSVQIVITSALAGEVYNKTLPLRKPIQQSAWWNYFFEPIESRNVLNAFDFPAYSDASISITMTAGTGNPVECGVCVIGTIAVFSEAVKFGCRIGIQDYSRKERDDWGNYEFVERGFAKRANWDLLVPSGLVDSLLDTLAGLRATPAIYVGGDNYGSLTLYGIYKDFDIVISYPQFSECSIELEGLI